MVDDADDGQYRTRHDDEETRLRARVWARDAALLLSSVMAAMGGERAHSSTQLLSTISRTLRLYSRLFS